MGQMGIVFFAASYGAALVLELTHLWFPSRLRGALVVLFVAVGLLAHTVFLGYRAVTITGSPLSSEMDWCLLAAWLLVALYLGLVFSYPRSPFGLVLLPLALGLIGAGAWWASRTPYPQPAASQVWGFVHAAAILLATVAILAAFTAGVLYLLQAYQLKQRRGPSGRFWLPSLEWLQRMNSRSLSLALGALALGLFSGIVLNGINFQQHVPALPWADPLVITTLAMFGWLLVALVLVIWYRPADEVRKVAWITIVSFVFLLTALAALLLMDTAHGRTRHAPTNQTGGFARPEAEPNPLAKPFLSDEFWAAQAGGPPDAGFLSETIQTV